MRSSSRPAITTTTLLILALCLLATKYSKAAKLYTSDDGKTGQLAQCKITWIGVEEGHFPRTERKLFDKVFRFCLNKYFGNQQPGFYDFYIAQSTDEIEDTVATIEGNQSSRVTGMNLWWGCSCRDYEFPFNHDGGKIALAEAVSCFASKMVDDRGILPYQGVEAFSPEHLLAIQVDCREEGPSSDWTTVLSRTIDTNDIDALLNP